MAELNRPTSGKPIPLWDTPAPHSRGNRPEDMPTLTPYWPLRGEDVALPALLIFPGGGYQFLSAQEGEGYARFFSVHGFACFVLNYRLPVNGYLDPVPLMDAIRAIRLLRARNEEWGIDASCVGVIGSSAGGHLAAHLLTDWDRLAEETENPGVRGRSRPDFGILSYPCITAGEHAHPCVKTTLPGPDADDEARARVSLENMVCSDTPPTFIWHTVEDPAVPVENAMLFASALRQHDIPFELHLYEEGPHGIGIGEGHPWLAACLHWLRCRGFAPRPVGS